MNPIERNPDQPLVTVGGVVRYKQNAIVRYLLDNGGFSMNDLALIPFSEDDRRQFAQLIGYSVCGFSDLGYADESD